MSLTRFAAGLLLTGLVLTAAAGCGGRGSATPTQRSTSPEAAGDLPDVLAEIGDEQITMVDIRARVGENLDQIEIQYRRARQRAVQNALDEILRDRVLAVEARRQGKTIEDLILDEAGGSLEPTPVEVAAWYDNNRDRVSGRTLEQLRSQIEDYLRGERRTEAMERLEHRVNAEHQVTVHLEPYRLPLDNEGAPSYGPENAAVTFVEFSDFQCPYCAQFFPTLNRLKADYGDRVRFVYRQFPIPSLHPQAFKAAEASLCAHEQGKFWNMHDLMFQEQNQLRVPSLKAMARRLGLDQRAFDTCLDSGRFASQVQEDFAEGQRVGVTGTPGLFVNGIPIEGGAVAYEVVAKVMDEELQRAKR